MRVSITLTWRVITLTWHVRVTQNLKAILDAQLPPTLPHAAKTLPDAAQTLPKRLLTLFNVVRTRAPSLNLRTFRTSRRRQAACLQRCNNVAQKLPDVVQRWYNLVVSWATQHNVAQHYMLAARLPQRCHTLPKRYQTLGNVAKLQPNVYQRCQNTC